MPLPVEGKGIPDCEDKPHEGTALLLNGSSGRLQLEEDYLDLARARRIMFLSHFFNQFSENAWQFCLVLFLAAFATIKALSLSAPMVWYPQGPCPTLVRVLDDSLTEQIDWLLPDIHRL